MPLILEEKGGGPIMVLSLLCTMQILKDSETHLACDLKGKEEYRFSMSWRHTAMQGSQWVKDTQLYWVLNELKTQLCGVLNKIKTQLCKVLNELKTLYWAGYSS